MVIMSENLKSVVQSTPPMKLSLFNKVRFFFWKRRLQVFMRDILARGCTIEISGSLDTKIVYSIIYPESMDEKTVNELTKNLGELMVKGINIFGGNSSKYQVKNVINNENT